MSALQRTAYPRTHIFPWGGSHSRVLIYHTLPTPIQLSYQQEQRLSGTAGCRNHHPHRPTHWSQEGTCHPLPAKSLSRMNKAASGNHEEQVFASIVAEEAKTNEQPCNTSRCFCHSESSIFHGPHPTPYLPFSALRNFSIDSLWNIFLLGWKERHIVSLKINNAALFILFPHTELTVDLGMFLLLHKSG